MKYLIVNGDDFGASSGINRGILEAYERGVLTSASLMVDMPASREAAGLGRRRPDLDLGLHACFTHEDGRLAVDVDRADRCRAELRRQVERFAELLGHVPSHLDSHHNAHRDPRLLPHFLEAAEEFALPLRERSPIRYFSSFYGQWDGETHLEQVGVAKLEEMLVAEVGEGFTELACHPGYVDPDFTSSYAKEREAEVRTLCDPAVRARIEGLKIHLVDFRDAKRLAASPAG